MLPVVLAPAGALRLRRAHKRRGVRARLLRPERAENRLPALPERGPWRAERRMGRPHMPLARDHGRELALAAIACEKSDLVHVPPGLVHVRGGVKKSIFFYEFVPPGRIEGITGAPWRVLPPPVPSEGGVPKSASSGHVTGVAVPWRYAWAGEGTRFFVIFG